MELAPPRIATKEDIVNAASFLKDNMTIAFLGDSTMHQQYERLCSVLGGKNSRMKWKYKNYMSVPGSCIIKSTNSSLRFFGIGKKFGWGLLPHVAHTLNATMRTLTSTDVVVLNLGVHWSQSCLKKFQHQNEEYAKELLSLQPLLDQDLDLCQDAHRDNMELTSTLQPRRYPLLIWKETSPQHFPTSNGLYPEGQRFHGDVQGLTRGQPLKCYEMTPARMSGAGLLEYDACNPSCLPANWQNDMANAYFASKCVDILPVWEDLKCLHAQHLPEDKWDCTHFTLAVVDTLNLKLLTHIASLLM